MVFDAPTFLADLFRPTREPEIGVADLPGDWRVWFEERAAIREYDGGLTREHAEAEALAETIRLMQGAKKN